MIDLIKYAKIVFWDFDGVIKESVDVKREAFARLFDGCSDDLRKRIMMHHDDNGGVSRYEKIPVYLEWLGRVPTNELINEYSNKFSQIVKSEVIDSEWVPCVEDYIVNNNYQQIFILVSATPQQEIEEIVSGVNLINCFDKVFGSSTSKCDAISETLLNLNISESKCVMIGDSVSDLMASKYNNVPFVLRKHSSNKKITMEFDGCIIHDLCC